MLRSTARHSDALEAAYRERDQRPVWRLTPLAPPAMADLLAGRGYRPIERSLLQVCPLEPGFAPVAGSGDPARAVGRLDRGLLHLQPGAARSIATPCAACWPSIAAPAGFAFVEEAGQPMAMAIGAVQGDHMGLFDVLVMPQARRRGLARKVTESLYAWAWRHGARFAYLQVVATNEAAMPLYAAQGFRTVYDYEYFVPPSP